MLFEHFISNQFSVDADTAAHMCMLMDRPHRNISAAMKQGDYG